MKKTFFLSLLAVLILSCSTTKKVSENIKDQNNTSIESKIEGSLFENAIVIKEKSEHKGVDAEYAWLREHYPGYKLKGQSLLFHNDKPYDLIEIITADGTEVGIYFDISNFYGKF